MGSFAGDGPAPPPHSTTQIGRSTGFTASRGTRRTRLRRDAGGRRETSPPRRAAPSSTRRRLQEPAWSPSMEMAGCSSNQLQKEMEELEMIQVFIDEELEIEAFSGMVSRLKVRGKMAVGFPPNSDRFVQFGLGKLFDLELESHPRIDKDVLRNQWIAKPISPERPFYIGPADILKWNQEVFDVPPMVKVTAETAPNLTRPEGIICNMVSVRYMYTGPTPLQDLVIKIPLPRVDETGEARKVVKTHIWHNTGAHIEREDCVEWHIGSVNGSNGRGDFTVDYFYEGGTYDWAQFYPVNARFSYADSRALEVLRVRGSNGLLEFGQSKLGHCSYTVLDPFAMERRAAEAEAAAKAWQEQPWEHEGGNFWV